MTKYIKLDDIKTFPIRLDHCDRKNGNVHFVLGIETVMEYIDCLPVYEFEEAEPITRPDFDYDD